MKNLTQLVQEQKNYFIKEIIPTLHPYGDYDEIDEWHTSSLTAIIRSEIERKKGMMKLPPTEIEFKSNIELQVELLNRFGYNTAIAEDIAYLENVLQELEKNI